MPFKQEEKAMRMTVPLILAAALAASTPALAQDANNTAAVDVNATNVVATDANAVVPPAANDVAAAPVEPVANDMATTEPAPEKKGGGFPWGVLGLLGLIGLFPRRGR
jgi:hypothetical protein